MLDNKKLFNVWFTCGQGIELTAKSVREAYIIASAKRISNGNHYELDSIEDENGTHWELKGDLIFSEMKMEGV